jgi:hypothetical protein
LLKEGIRITSFEERPGFQSTGESAAYCGFIRNGSGSGTVAVNAVATRAKYNRVLVVSLAGIQVEGTTQNSFEIPSTPAVTSYWAGKLTTRDQTIPRVVRSSVLPSLGQPRNKQSTALINGLLADV